MHNNDIPMFFDRKVVKPVRGGGAKSGSNPYSNVSSNKNAPMQFSEFM